MSNMMYMFEWVSIFLAAMFGMMFGAGLLALFLKWYTNVIIKLSKKQKEVKK